MVVASVVAPPDATAIQGLIINPTNPVIVSRQVASDHRGAMLTRLSCTSLALMLASSTAALVMLHQYTKALSTPGTTMLICPETHIETAYQYMDGCAEHSFNKGWCTPGDITAGGYYAYGRRTQDVETDPSTSTSTTTTYPDGSTTSSEPQPGGISVGVMPAHAGTLPCPEGYISRDTLVAEGVAVALLWLVALGLMTVFPGVCSCCADQTTDGCNSITAMRLVSFIASYVVCGLALLISVAIAPYMYVGEIETMSAKMFACLVVLLPLGSFGLMTFARFLARTCEGSDVAPMETVSNTQHCIGITIGFVVVLILTPVVYSVSIVDRDTILAEGGSTGYGGYGYGWIPGGTAPRCRLATEVQYWDCGCDAVATPALGAPSSITDTYGAGGGTEDAGGRLRTIGSSSSAPDAQISRVVSSWIRYSGEHEDEPAGMDIHATYPWLNPTCQDIGVSVRFCT